MLAILFKLLGSIALLIYGMKVMSEALQKIAGPGLRHVLGTMTTNRFTGVLTGILICVAVQSSAATTVMTVSFVNAALLTLSQAIAVIMGANIGTTLSAWIMSAGFSFNIADFVWPAFLIAVILIQSHKHRYLGDFLFGLSFLLFALGTLNATGREMDLASNQAIVDFFASFPSDKYYTIIIFLIFGTILTCIAQSSAALMAITMVLCSSGVITIYQGIALVLGENIGTTVTANLAALSANTQARRAALAHLIFNVFGVLWVLCAFYPFVNLSCNLVGVDPHADVQNPARLTFVLATFHTLFNVTNTMILIWFIPQIEKLTGILIRSRETEDEFKLQYIESGIMKTPEIAIFQAQKETGLFAGRMRDMFSEVVAMAAIPQKEEDKLKAASEHIRKMEEMSDRMESEIGSYLAQVSDSHLSDDTKRKVRVMLRAISELESVGDSCLNLCHIIERKNARNISFTSEQEEDIDKMFDLVSKALENMELVLNGGGNDALSYELENAIDALRTQLRAKNTADIDEGLCSFDTGAVFYDFIRECEKCGDYAINVVEAKLGKRENIPEIAGLQIDTVNRKVTIDGRDANLTAIEFELLSLLTSNQGRVFSKSELIDIIWPKDSGAVEKDVEESIRSIKEKLLSLGSHISFRQGFGYLFE